MAGPHRGWLRSERSVTSTDSPDSWLNKTLYVPLSRRGHSMPTDVVGTNIECLRAFTQACPILVDAGTEVVATRLLLFG